MFHEFDLLVPAFTAKASSAVETAALTKGHVTAVEIMFPRGCAGQVFVVVERGESQLWPSNPDGAHKGDGVVLRWDEDYPLPDEPLTLTLRGWAPAARFDHTITFRFEMVPLDQAEAARALPGLVRRMAGALIGNR